MDWRAKRTWRDMPHGIDIQLSEVTDAEWLEQASQWHETYCHDLEVMSSNLKWVELGVYSTSQSSLSRTWTTNISLSLVRYENTQPICSVENTRSHVTYVCPFCHSETTHASFIIGESESEWEVPLKLFYIIGDGFQICQPREPYETVWKHFKQYPKLHANMHQALCAACYVCLPNLPVTG